MGIEAVQQEVLSLKEKEGSIILSEAEKKAAKIEEETISLLKEEEKKSEEETNHLVEQLKAAVAAQAKFEVKKIELNSRKEMINNVFEKAKSLIGKLDEKTLEGLNRVLLQNAGKEIETAHIICNEKTKKWMPCDLDVKTEDMLGGVIVENADRTLRVDNRFETILEEVRKDALKRIAKTIF